MCCWHDQDNSILSWLRRDRDGNFVVCVSNFTPVIRYDYRLGVPQTGAYEEILNTDADSYGATENTLRTVSAALGVLMGDSDAEGDSLTVIAFDDEEEALAIANDVPYGLTGYVWTSDVTRA